MSVEERVAEEVCKICTPPKGCTNSDEQIMDCKIRGEATNLIISIIRTELLSRIEGQEIICSGLDVEKEDHDKWNCKYCFSNGTLNAIRQIIQKLGEE